MKEGITDCTIIGTGIGGGDNGKSTFVAIDCEAPDGEIVTIKLYTSPSAWPYTQDKLARLGWDSDARHMAFEEFNEPDNVLIGVKCAISTKEEEYNGQMRQRHDVWFPARATRHEPTKAKSLAEAMRRTIDPSDDEIPF